MNNSAPSGTFKVVDLSNGDVTEAARFLDSPVRVSGPVKNSSGADMIGTLTGITFLEASVIVYMDNNQSTSFARVHGEPIIIQGVSISS